MKVFAERVKKLRNEHGKTQTEMAEYLGIGLRAYQFYESATHYPNVPGLMKIADYFQVTTDYLLGRSDERGAVSVGESSVPPGVPEDAGGQTTFSLTDAARYGIMSKSRKRGLSKMEQTDRAFCGFLRLLIARLKALSAEQDPQKKDALLQEILTDLQNTLED